jgi:small subunit ribosomal protein S4e
MAKLKRLVAPKFWRLEKKKSKWTVSVRPGPHKKERSIPLQIVLREILKLVETGKEAQNILNNKEVFVDGRVVTDHAFGVGLMDVISIPKIKKYYRVVPNPKGFILIEIPENEAKLKLLRINSKTVIKKGKMQLNLHDGRNLLVPKDEYSSGDSILVEVPEMKIVDHVKLAPGSLILLFEGKDIGTIGKVKEVVTGHGEARIAYEVEGVADETIKDHVIVIGKNKPLIKVGEKNE